VPSQATDWATEDPAQAEVYEAFASEMKNQWVWLYRSRGEIQGHSIGQFSALLAPERVAHALKDPSWEVEIGGGGFGFTTYYEDGNQRNVYERYPDDGAELLVNRRYFDGVREPELELVEEFRLLFNLWEDRSTRTYYYFDESGNPVKAAVIQQDGVKVLAHLVRRFQAAKRAYLAMYIDSTLWSNDLPGEDRSWDISDEEKAFTYYCGKPHMGDRPFSRLLGKRLIAPLPVEACGIPPYEKEKEYQDFLIGLSETGEEIKFSADPSQLANNFGANSGNPHYLTPVYFRREVLGKYYADPDRFSVEDGYVRCTGLWGLRLDNDHPDHIMVFLGDLGRDIPQAEAQYWRSFNILPPDEGPSETLIRRALRAEFADPKSADLRFPYEYRKTNQVWEKVFGWPLYKPLHEDDEHVLGKLHVPVTDSASEFDEQVLYLAKLLVDSLNGDGINSAIGKGEQGEKELRKLERFLDEAGVEDPRRLLEPFANVQGLRSRGAAHRKGSSFDISTAIGDVSRRTGFERLLTEAIDTLQILRSFAEGIQQSSSS
jgi:hypothetical protein